MQFTMTNHALRTIADKGISEQAVREVWDFPATQYPSHKHPGQHKRTGNGICLACDDVTGRVITVFVDQVNTRLRSDQTSADAQAWADRNGMR